MKLKEGTKHLEKLDLEPVEDFTSTLKPRYIYDSWIFSILLQRYQEYIENFAFNSHTTPIMPVYRNNEDILDEQYLCAQIFIKSYALMSNVNFQEVVSLSVQKLFKLFSPLDL